MLSKTQKQQLSDLIKQYEAKTSGEFVLVLNRRADDYWFIPSLWAAVFALCVPAILSFLPQLPNLSLLDLASLQFMVFIGLVLLFRWSPILLRLIPKTVKHQRAHRIAMEQFFLQGVSSTVDRTGVLFFVSVDEHYVEIIADQGINEKVTEEFWQSVVADFIACVKRGELLQGYEQAIHRCGEELVKQFPAERRNINELADCVIEIA